MEFFLISGKEGMDQPQITEVTQPESYTCNQCGENLKAQGLSGDGRNDLGTGAVQRQGRALLFSKVLPVVGSCPDLFWGNKNSS